MALRLAILGCDIWAPSIVQHFGDISEQYNYFMRLSQKSFTSKIFNIQKKEFPSNINEYDGYIITGSKYSAYDDEDWIRFLFDKIKLLDSSKKKVLGVCFGHQVNERILVKEY